jgi:hypothetical protein
MINKYTNLSMHIENNKDLNLSNNLGALQLNNEEKTISKRMRIMKRR